MLPGVVSVFVAAGVGACALDLLVRSMTWSLFRLSLRTLRMMGLVNNHRRIVRTRSHSHEYLRSRILQYLAH